MKKACPYCGKIHERNITCPQKPEQSRTSEADKFHYTSQWKEKSLHIRKRDLFLCVACRANLRGTVKRLNNEDLSVHHIIPLKVDYSLRLDDRNLITLCRTHHEMAESGELSAGELSALLDTPPEGRRSDF